MARLIVLVGPSGAGKTALAMTLEVNGIARRIVTCTTRAPRPGEVPGTDYVFCSLDAFMAMTDAGALAESEFIHDHWYGVPLAGIRAAWVGTEPHTVVLGPGGAARVKAMAPDKVTVVAIAPPNPATLAERLHGRGTPVDEITQRLAVTGEWPTVTTADVAITNDDWDTAYAALVQVVQGHSAL